MNKFDKIDNDPDLLNFYHTKRIEMFERIKDKMESMGSDTTIVDKFIEDSKNILNDYNTKRK